MNRRIEELMQGCILEFIGVIVAFSVTPDARNLLLALIISYQFLLLVRFLRGDYDE